MNSFILFLAGIIVGTAAAFTGLGGGFLVVPLLLLFGYSADRAVGTSFLVILPIAISAAIAHARLQNIDYRVGILLALGGIIGAQIGARAVEFVPTEIFKKLFALILILLAIKIAVAR